ncbi:hypothetical protein GQ457_01G030260 [Hibiscus cannabinus]
MKVFNDMKAHGIEAVRVCIVLGIGICHDIAFDSPVNPGSALDHFLHLVFGELDVAYSVELGRDLNDCSTVGRRIELVHIADFLEFVAQNVTFDHTDTVGHVLYV